MGPITIHWYGLFLVLGMAAGITVAWRLSHWHQLEPEQILDLSLWLIIGGILGARIYEIFLEAPYYFQHPLAMFKFWEGGLAIHGAIIGGFLALYLFAKKHHLSVLTLIALIVPGLALGQAIGRWGNWFNQELFGLPTSLPWGIPISSINRPLAYATYDFFHPTFLYESVGCLIIFVTLLTLSYYWRQQLNQRRLVIIAASYLLGYAVLRFSLELIKIDPTPMLWGLRWPQWASIILALISLIWLLKSFKKKSLWFLDY